MNLEQLTSGPVADLDPGQSFTKSLIVSEWMAAPVTGVYQFEIEIPGVTNTAMMTVVVGPRDPERLQIAYGKLLLRAATLPWDESNASRVMSFAVDPEAVPFLQIAAHRQDLNSDVMNGLIRIGDRTALKAIEQFAREGTESVRKNALAYLRIFQIRTADPALKEEIASILQSLQ